MGWPDTAIVPGSNMGLGPRPSSVSPVVHLGFAPRASRYAACIFPHQTQQAHQATYATYPEYGPFMNPTELGNVFATMNLPRDNSLYMDSGATAHIRNSSYTVMPLFNLSTPDHILVGNAHRIPVHGNGQSSLPTPHPPLALRDVFFAPQIINNLICVRKFTSNNNVSIEFDPYDFSVKDLRTGNIIAMCYSSGELYSVTTTQPSPSTCLATALTDTSSTTWYDRLGHPGSLVLSFLRNRDIIHCHKDQPMIFAILVKYIVCRFTNLIVLLILLLILFILIYGPLLFVILMVINII